MLVWPSEKGKWWILEGPRQSPFIHVIMLLDQKRDGWDLASPCVEDDHVQTQWCGVWRLLERASNEAIASSWQLACQTSPLSQSFQLFYSHLLSLSFTFVHRTSPAYKSNWLDTSSKPLPKSRSLLCQLNNSSLKFFLCLDRLDLECWWLHAQASAVTARNKVDFLGLMLSFNTPRSSNRSWISACI